jgi:Tfp pilus assembly protein PilO
MKRLSPAKRQQLILVVTATVALISIVYFLIIRPEYQQNHQLASNIKTKAAELQRRREAINHIAAVTNMLTEVRLQLAAAEGDIATGDINAWTYETIRQFKSGYHVDIPGITQPVSSEVELIPDFPYKQVKVVLTGTGYYHDLGKFLADFENKFPHAQILNLNAQPDTGAAETLGDKPLTFRMEIATLVKPNT